MGKSRGAGAGVATLKLLLAVRQSVTLTPQTHEVASIPVAAPGPPRAPTAEAAGGVDVCCRSGLRAPVLCVGMTCDGSQDFQATRSTCLGQPERFSCHTRPVFAGVYFNPLPVVVITSFPCLTPRRLRIWSAMCLTSELRPFMMTTSKQLW